MALTRTAIVAAMPGELRPLVRGWRHEKRNRVHLWRRRAGQTEWVAACAGVGQNAAVRALKEIERDGPVASIFSVGWAGALRDDRKPGEAYRVRGVVDLPTNTRLATAPFDSARIKSGGAATDIWLATATKVVTQAEKQYIAISFYADLVDMEAIAIARVAKARGVAFHCIKGVSDGAEDQLPDFNPFLTADGRFRRVRFIVFALFHPGYWQGLKQMGENSKKAAEHIAVQVLEILDPEGKIRKTNGDSNLSR
jgi:adenosylhomocysteine nucleosidase